VAFPHTSIRQMLCEMATHGRVYAPRPPLAGKRGHKAAASGECIAGLKDLIAVKTLCKRPLATSATAGAGWTLQAHSGSLTEFFSKSMLLEPLMFHNMSSTPACQNNGWNAVIMPVE